MATAPAVTLDDKWTITRGRILLSGTQAIARVLLAPRSTAAGSTRRAISAAIAARRSAT